MLIEGSSQRVDKDGFLKIPKGSEEVCAPNYSSGCGCGCGCGSVTFNHNLPIVMFYTQCVVVEEWKWPQLPIIPPIGEVPGTETNSPWVPSVKFCED